MSDDRLTKNSGGVTTTAGFSSEVGSPSAEVLLTNGVGRKRKKLGKGDAAGIITTIDGKKIKLTGLSQKEKDEYLFGDTKIEKALDYLDMVTEYMESLKSPNLEDDDGSLEKCDMATSALIKGKKGVWRRISGRPCFICGDGTIHAGPKVFVGKKAATLRDQLRSEKSSTKKAKTGK